MSDIVGRCQVALQALSDWAVTYAPDMCGEETVAKAKDRVLASGTLAYIANATGELSGAIARIDQLERENAELRGEHDQAKMEIMGRGETIDQLERELASSRETNRKLHRRAQLAEAANQCAPDYLKAWLEVLTQSPGRNRERRLVLWIIRDIQDRFGKLSDRARRLAEQEGT